MTQNDPIAAGDDIAVSVRSLGKVHRLYDRPVDRLKQLIWPRGTPSYREFVALQDISFELPRGEVLGLVGRNGAGKSTLLQAICGTLTPTSGSVTVRGRVAALLELGAGFNPEFTGRENVYLNAAVLGLTRAEIDARYDAIVEFSGLASFVEQPVKTYSSGMYMRLAFSIATSVEPDILIIDEALSVGDGAFSRKSFDRIMQLKNGGATILFCSHSTYQVEALCSRAVWLDQGRLRMIGDAATVVDAYSRTLQADLAPPVRADMALPVAAPGAMGAAAAEASAAAAAPGASTTATAADGVATPGFAMIRHIKASADGTPAVGVSSLMLDSLESELRVRVEFAADPQLPPPSIAYEVQTEEGQTISSATSMNQVLLERDEHGEGSVELVFSRLPLMRGKYRMNFYLTCEGTLHFYEHALDCVRFEVRHPGLERGVVFLPHEWQLEPGEPADAGR
ncbi:MAG: ABC transporter ATP-binding protein [Comamonadaceae bacterium]|nr:MAG: ABC transporter ATP-binding protein [Comamonadaceae bacterium]